MKKFMDNAAGNLLEEISEQDMNMDRYGAEKTSVRMTAQGRCGWIFTHSAECRDDGRSCGN